MKKVLFTVFWVVFLDQWLKIYIKTHFEYGEMVSLIGHWCNLAFVENPGMAYGIQLGGLNGKIALTLIRIILITGIGWWIYQLSKKYFTNTLLMVSVGLIFGGAIGNLIDSVFYGFLFDKGTVYNVLSQDWDNYLGMGIAQLDFTGYAGLFEGTVVDMFYFPIIQTTWPTWMPMVGGNSFVFFSPIFNLADSAISIGVVLILFFNRQKIMD